MSAALKQATQIKIQMNVVKGPHAGQQFLFYKTPLTIGRGPENDVVLLNDPLVSRLHAKIELNQNIFELSNLSEKNALLVHNEVVSKSALVNDSVFQIGDSEFVFHFDLGQAVVSVPARSMSPPLPAATKAENQAVVLKQAIPKKTESVPAVKLSSAPLTKPSALGPVNQPSPPFQQSGSQKNYRAAVSPDETQNKRLRFYAVIVLIIGVFGYFIFSSGQKNKAGKPKPMLKYEDEIAVNLKSEKEDTLRKKREEDKKAKNSPQIQRAEENFIKGMRDFQLGNYARAQDFFQVVLNLIPDHPLARRHLYLSKVRFDELVQAKLMLGESNYQKHNFSMCESLYKQVMDMLQGKGNDQKFQLAQRMAEKCQFAAEGIR